MIKFLLDLNNANAIKIVRLLIPHHSIKHRDKRLVLEL